MRSLRATNPKPRHADLSRIAQFQRNADSIDRAVQFEPVATTKMLPGVLSLAYIGNAWARMHEEHRGACPRRFRLGDEKEGAGVCGGCGQAMGIELPFSCNMLNDSDLAGIGESRLSMAWRPMIPE